MTFQRGYVPTGIWSISGSTLAQAARTPFLRFNLSSPIGGGDQVVTRFVIPALSTKPGQDHKLFRTPLVVNFHDMQIRQTLVG
jgi:hypothetical protein